MIDQTVLRGRDGIRWVVTTAAEGGAFLTTARRTGCDLRPAAAVRHASIAEARAAHQAYCAAIAATGRPTTEATAPAT